MSDLQAKAVRVLATLAMLLLPACGAEDEPGAPAPVAPQPVAEVETAPPPAASAPAPAPAGPRFPGPLTSPTGEWKWFDIPGAECGNGAQTGIGVSLGTGKDVVIYLEGGGMCWDEVSCHLSINGAPTASHIFDGYDQKKFEATFAGPKPGSIFDRTLPNNPFKNASVVYVPYCTGDFHSGSTVQKWLLTQKTMHFSGRKNLELALAQIVPSFPDASRVTLSGSSAGGFGAEINYWRVNQAFAGKRVDLVSDSAPMFTNMAMVTLGMGPWNLAAALPPDCKTCGGDFRAIYGHYAKTYPTSRFAFLSFSADELMHIGAASIPEIFQRTMADLQNTIITPLANTRYFVPSGKDHTMLYRIGVESDSVTLADWLTQMTTDSPEWTNRR